MLARGLAADECHHDLPAANEEPPLSTRDYLHDCLDLFQAVTKHRYGKIQRLDEVERRVAGMLKDGRGLWEIIRYIYDNGEFDAEIFGFLPDEIEAELKKTTWHLQWQTLPEKELVEQLHGVFRQIEPVSMVLRFIDPNRYGIFSSPVATILGVRHRRRAAVMYQEAYLKSLRKVRDERGFDRTADVEMALWALHVGVLDGHLPDEQRRGLKESYERDVPLRRLATANLTSQLFSENTKLQVAEYLLGQKEEVALAGQIAGIEFEEVVVKHDRSAVRARQDETLRDLVNRFEPSDIRPRLNRARAIRNDAIHPSGKVTKEDVEFLIKMAREVEALAP